MGAVAELIKAAELKQAVDPSAMASKLDALQQRATKMPSAADSLASLSKLTPTAEQESRNNALKWIAATGIGAAGLGAILRGLRSHREGTRRKKLIEDIDPYAGMPGREITIPLPHTKKSSVEKKANPLIPAAIAAATAPSVARAAGSSVGDVWEKTKGGVRKGFEHLFAPTGSAFDNPWFLPGALAAALGGGYLGYSQLDNLLEGRREERAARQMARARKEFEDALRAQYRESELFEQAGKNRPKLSDGGSFKFSAAGMMGVVADAFAQAHTAGELDAQFASMEKEAQDLPEEQQGFGWNSFKGSGRKALGAYIAALAVLTAAGGAAGYSFVKGREGTRRKHEMAKDVMRRRALATPPTVTVEPT